MKRAKKVEVVFLDAVVKPNVVRDAWKKIGMGGLHRQWRPNDSYPLESPPQILLEVTHSKYVQVHTCGPGETDFKVTYSGPMCKHAKAKAPGVYAFHIPESRATCILHT